MKRLKLLLLICVCAFVPAQARGDDGWWLEWLWKMDPKLVGFGSAVHLCVDRDNKIMDCEEWWGIHQLFDPNHKKFEDIKDQIDFRFGFYWKYGQRFDTASGNALDLPDLRQIQAYKLGGEYHRSLNPYFALGGGAAFVHFMGDGFDSFPGGVATVSAIWAPFKSGVKKVIIIRPEAGYLFTNLTASRFGNTVSTYSNGGGEPTYSISFGFDVRRRALPDR